MVIAKRFSPLPFHRFRFVYDKLALPDHFPTACNIAQSHELSSLFFIIILLGFCLSPTYEHAHVGSDLLTLALIPTDCSVLRTPTILISIYLTIFRDKKEALHFGGAPFVASRGQILMQAWNSAPGMPRGNCSLNFKKF